jgi:hypothetical protein
MYQLCAVNASGNLGPRMLFADVSAVWKGLCCWSWLFLLQKTGGLLQRRKKNAVEFIRLCIKLEIIKELYYDARPNKFQDIAELFLL